MAWYGPRVTPRAIFLHHLVADLRVFKGRFVFVFCVGHVCVVARADLFLICVTCSWTLYGCWLFIYKAGWKLVSRIWFDPQNQQNQSSLPLRPPFSAVVFTVLVCFIPESPEYRPFCREVLGGLGPTNPRKMHRVEADTKARSSRISWVSRHWPCMRPSSLSRRWWRRLLRHQITK
jgi:hypothetical protein